MRESGNCKVGTAREVIRCSSKWPAIEIYVCRETVLHEQTMMGVNGNSYLYHHTFIYCSDGPKPYE